MLDYESVQVPRSKGRGHRAPEAPLITFALVALASGIACMSRVRVNDYNLALFAAVLYGVGMLAVVVGIVLGIISLVAGRRTSSVVAVFAVNCVLLLCATWLAYAWLNMLL